MPDEQRLFVGREQELAALKEAIARPEGQILLAVGGVGFGKTSLLEQLNIQLADDERYFGLLYRLNRNDTSEAFLFRLMGDLLNIENLTRRRIVLNAPRQVERWQTLAKLIPGVGEGISELLPDDRRPIRDRFLEFLHAAAGQLKDRQRLALIFDPDEHLDDSVEADWGSLARDLPARTTIIFAQRLDDCLAQSAGLRRAPNVFRIPDGLHHLSREESDGLVASRWGEREAWQALGDSARAELAGELWRKYEGYALPLTMALRDLPEKPGSFDELIATARALPADYEALLRKQYSEAVKTGQEAARVLHGLAILEVPATCDRLAALHADQGCQADSLVSACRPDEVARCLTLRDGGVVEFFHATMGECVLEQMSDDAKRDLHGRAASLYKEDLGKNKSDGEALDRLPYHLRRAGDDAAFVDTVIEVFGEKHRLRMLRSCLSDCDEALKVLPDLVKADPAKHRPYLAGVMSNRGTVLVQLGDRQGARRALESALDACRELAAEDPSNNGHVAMTLNNLGLVLRDLGERAQAREALEEALEIRRDLAKDEPAAFLPYVAGTLNNLGLALSDLGARSKARAAHEEALSIRRDLAKAEPAAFLPDVAETLNNLGIVLCALGERARARQVYEEALGIYRKLVEAEPAAFLPYVAGTLNNLGNVLCALGERAQAREALEEALEIRRDLAKVEPAAFLPDVAMTLNNLGLVLTELEEWAQARQALEEALEIRRKLAEAEPAAFLPYVATTLNNLGDLLREMAQPREAHPALEEALAIYRKLAEAEPAAFEPDIAMTLNNLGNVLSDLGERAPARQAYEEALAIYRKLAEAEPAAFQPYVAGTLSNLGLVLRDLEKLTEARTAYDEALMLLMPWVEREPGAFRQRLAMVVGNAVGLLRETGERPEDWPALVQAEKLLAQIKAAEKEDTQDES